MGLEADVFRMLIERLGAVEDSMRQVRADLEMILLPRLRDVTSGTVDEIKDRLTEQGIVRALASRATASYGSLFGDVPERYIQQLKAQGFRVYQSNFHAHPRSSTKNTIILWGEQQLNEELLRNVWDTPKDFVQL